MSGITYQDLKEYLNSLDDEQLQMNVTVWDAEDDEYYPVSQSLSVDDTDVLDDNHPILVFKEPIGE